MPRNAYIHSAHVCHTRDDVGVCSCKKLMVDETSPIIHFYPKDFEVYIYTRYIYVYVRTHMILIACVPYQKLMVDETSPIIHFYPKDFEVRILYPFRRVHSIHGIFVCARIILMISVPCQKLMVDETSPIIHFYPKDFEVHFEVYSMRLAHTCI